MANIEASIGWYEQRVGNVSYSMANRYGPNSYDCSSAVYFALAAGEFFPAGKMGNTDTLFNDLGSAGWQRVTSHSRGDVFIWGVEGASGGAYGHTGIFLDNSRIIHCNAGSNGISVDDYVRAWNGAGQPPETVFHSLSVNVPTLNTVEERTAFTLANVLSVLGYSLASIAGICGNAEVESGLNPDRDQDGGPAYGVVQWDGSAYPLVGDATNNGREYVQRLMEAGGINGDYRTAEPQARLIDWCMYNGQWTGAVEPATVEAFKASADVAGATAAFLKNFERAGVGNLEKRIQAAERWHGFLNGLDFKESGYETMANVGALEVLGIKEGKIVAEGWHFSSDKPQQYIAFINAENDKELGRIKALPISRPDIKEEYPNVLGIENAGFSVSFEVENDTAVYIKGIRTGGKGTDELIFDKIIIFEQAFAPQVEAYAKTNSKFFYEIYKKGRVVKRGSHILNELGWSNELMFVPETELVFPIEYREYIAAREEIKVYINKKVFHGTVTAMQENHGDGTIEVKLSHIVYEWQNRQISTNLAAKNRTINDIYSTLDFRYPNWNINYFQDSAGRVIDYVYSRQNKLEGLTKTCELTEDLFWRVGFSAGRTLDIGSFGDKKPYLLSVRPSGRSNIQIISEPVIRHDSESVINIATVYGEKSDSGMTSMSLREVYEEKGAQDPNFPVVILKNGINNERGYDYIEFAKLAPNNNLEYAVIDSEGIALEGGVAIEGTFSFNDLAPFNVDSQEITEEDRAKAAKTAYDAAVKRLKLSRRRHIIELDVDQLPYDVNVGDKVRFLYNGSLYVEMECSNYMRKILGLDDWFFITGISYVFSKDGTEHDRVSLEKFIQVEREVDYQ